MAYIVLDKKNFFYNLDIIAQKTQSKDKIALVLKDNAYGHGLCEIAKLAREYGISKAVVRLEQEAKEIADFFEEILILADMPKKAKHNFTYTINELDAIGKFPKNTQVELKVDTGMHRNGITPQQLQEALKLIKQHQLKLRGIFTHHGCADEQNGWYEKQQAVFARVKEEARELVKHPIRFHSANSAALFRSSHFDEDLARIGIAAYGCLEMPSALCSVDFKPVLSLYAHKNSSRKVDTGECVGYGASFSASKQLTVSNYNFGYGDGFLRSCSNIYTTPQGISIAGRISMDNSSFVSDEEELLIFDDARNVAKFAGTISYEVLTSLKSHLKRLVR